MTYRTRDLGYYIIGREEEESKVQRIRDERETRDIRSREALRKSSMKKEKKWNCRENWIAGLRDLAGSYREKEVQTLPGPK